MKKECSNKVGDILIIINDKDGEFALDEGCWGWNLVLTDKDQEVLAADSAMAPWSAIARKQILVDPINNRPGVHLKESGHLVCRVDRFVRHLGFTCHAGNRS